MPARLKPVKLSAPQARLAPESGRLGAAHGELRSSVRHQMTASLQKSDLDLHSCLLPWTPQAGLTSAKGRWRSIKLLRPQDTCQLTHALSSRAFAWCRDRWRNRLHFPNDVILQGRGGESGGVESGDRAAPHHESG